MDYDFFAFTHTASDGVERVLLTVEPPWIILQKFPKAKLVASATSVCEFKARRKVEQNPNVSAKRSTWQYL